MGFVRGFNESGQRFVGASFFLKLLFVANSSFKLENFRSGLIDALRSDGVELIALVPTDSHTLKLRHRGVRVIPLHMDATGTSPLREAWLLWSIYRVMRSERPDAVLSYTIKSNIYSGLTSRWLGIPLLPNVTGLGSVFDQDTWLFRIVKSLYRTAFANCPEVYLQNSEDLELFVRSGLIERDQAVLLPGSGVDLCYFYPTSIPGKGLSQTFLLVARMLREKGVIEFAEAAGMLQKRYPEARFQLLGPFGTGKIGGLDERDIDALVRRTGVTYLGQTNDVRPFLAAADCVVLPSYYREGTPRSLLEAAAMGRPIITTDMPGCRDVVQHGATGYLCKPRDADDLEAKMEQFLAGTQVEREAMGRASRSRMEDCFDERRVIEAYRNAISQVAG